jgi:hypothetical protein
MATCEYRRVNRSISKSTTRSMAHLPGHCHRLHSADRLPVGPLLPGRHSCDCAASSATAPARPWPATPSAGSPSIRALRQRAPPRTAGPRDFPGRSRPDRPGPPRDTPAAAGGWPKPPEWLKVWIPYRTGISAFRDHATEPLMPAVNTRRSARFGVSRGPLISSLCGRLRDELPACQFDANGLCVSLHGGLRPTLRRESPGEPCRVREIGPVGLRPS